MCSLTPSRWRTKLFLRNSNSRPRISLHHVRAIIYQYIGGGVRLSGKPATVTDGSSTSRRENLHHTAHTLSKESPYFRSLMSDENQQLADGTFFVDADPGLLACVLRYLRAGIYPICFHRDSGHNYAAYMGIRQLAEQFGIDNLARWLVDRQRKISIDFSVSVQQMRL